MKKSIRIMSLILCLCLLFSSCTGKETSGEEITDSQQGSLVGGEKIALPYNKIDGLNPFFTQSYENIYMCALLFQPLYSTDGTYASSAVVAESTQVNENIATVKIRRNIACKGSSNITAEDVVYSFDMAKKSYAWADGLSGITAAKAVGQYDVEFTLSHKDIYLSGKLNFPIVKKGTADEANVIPTGSGSYYYSEGKLVNVQDSKKTIRLVTVGTRESVENAMTIGVTDVFFNDMAECNYTKSAALKQDVQLNNMVYLGFNSANGALESNIRSAIAAKLDCEKIAASAYQGYAKAMKLPLNPDSNLVRTVPGVPNIGDSKLANNIIDQCGYTTYTGRAKTNGAYVLAMTLIVNKENKFRVAAAYSIADSLNECGFLITVQALPFEEYVARIESGAFDMYLGEVKLDYSMDIAQFFTEGKKLSSGINVKEKVATEYFKYRAGEITAVEYYKIFAENYPFVPIAFRKGYILTSGEIKLSLKEMPYSLYSGI